MSRKGKTGASLGAVEISKAKRRALARKRREEEAAWRERSGPVTVTRMEPDQQRDEGAP